MSTSKSFSTETSDRYARALFELSSESSELDQIEKNLNVFLNIYNSSPLLVSFITNPTQSNDNQSNAIEIISKELDFSKNLKNFFYLLIKKKRLFFIKKIIKNFLKLCSQKRGEVKASLVSSKNLSQEELNEISSQFSQSIGSKIKFDYSVDETLIGGVKIQLGSLMVDTSIKNKLKKYEQLMIEN
ncbi:ATP synthase F1 subunit delta [Pelagibacteraceae bacterium]|nr:ATP synthase F1 subunit delta [Pelagibacteraceae bacterium]MDC0339514.1 ATP synthase F1 subunit delta [Pelagibacteraceae bacterium]MDC0366118.1 ATP synthase F1 subunit delta [Pelagibacteraceae bacterium]